MNTATSTSPMGMNDAQGVFAKAEAWLDARGKGAWIAAMVLGFIFVWPIGLALLAYMIWSKRMFNSSCKSMSRSKRHMGKSSGNAAFDAYKAETLRRLEEEQDNFEAFLRRLREAKDKAEFDQFMDDRARMNEVTSEDPDERPSQA
ncbi:MAG: DUF2852 domain-containing protein [Pseudomonadota bacterium]